MEMIPFLCLFSFPGTSRKRLGSKAIHLGHLLCESQVDRATSSYAEDIGRPTTNLRHEQYCNHSKIGTLS